MGRGGDGGRIKARRTMARANASRAKPARKTAAAISGAAAAALFDEQVSHLTESHFLVLLWAATAEDKGRPYNITNCFDDLKRAGITRTKQNAVATVDALHALRFLAVRDEGNRKNIYITTHGARGLRSLVLQQRYTPRQSLFLEE